MKKLPLLMLSLFTLPTYAQGILSTLNTYQGSLSTPSASTAGVTKQTGPEVKPSAESLSSTSQKCEENDQTSLPLAYVTSLIQEKNGALDIVHDPRSGTLSVNSADMIGNCSSMLEWKLNQPEISGKKAYALEVKIRKGDSCKPEGCSYKVAKVEKGEFKEYETIVLKPTLKGFEECLQKSGVVADGKVVRDAIYSAPIAEKFSGIDYTGKLLFQSHGPSSPLIKAKYGKFEHVAGCDYYEAPHPQIKHVMTLADAERDRLDAEADKLKECKPDEYNKLADFIEKNEAYAAVLGQIRDKLLLEAAKKSAAAIAAGKYSEDDIKVIQDFERYVVTPKVELARALYEQMVELEGDAKKAKQAELKNVLSEINSLNQKPYFTSAHTHKLIADGRFEDAEALNTLQLMIENHKRLGAKQDNVVITPAVASQRISNGREAFRNAMVAEKERYEYRTGQVTGKSAEYNRMAAARNRDIMTRTENFNAEIRLELERIQQPNGYCFKYWRNTQKCYAETIERVQQLQAIMNHWNKVDQERALEYEAKAKEYAVLEAEGRKYIAAQNGEEPAQDTSPQAETKEGGDNLQPTPRKRTEMAVDMGPQQPQGPVPFAFNQNPQQQAMMTPQGYQYPQMPYQNGYQQPMQMNPYQYNQPQPYLGQQAYPYQAPNPYGYQTQNGYGFNFGGQAQMQFGGGQPQTFGMPGYAQQPYQAYGQYNMYGVPRY